MANTVAQGFTPEAQDDPTKYISIINFNGTTYHLKDREAREKLDIVESLVSSPLIFKGVVSTASEITSLTNYKKGWTYKSNGSFDLPTSGLLTQKVESGDMIICVKDNASFVANDWTVVQSNVDIFKGASANANGTTGLVPQPKIADKDSYLKGDGTWGPIAKVDANAIDFDNTVFILDCGTASGPTIPEAKNQVF